MHNFMKKFMTYPFMSKGMIVSIVIYFLGMSYGFAADMDNNIERTPPSLRWNKPPSNSQNAPSYNNNSQSISPSNNQSAPSTNGRRMLSSQSRRISSSQNQIQPSSHGRIMPQLHQQNETSEKPIVIEIGKGIVVPDTRFAESIFVADVQVADVKSSPDETVFLYGKSIGTTTLIATGFDGKELFRHTVIVTHQIEDLNRMLKERFPSALVHLKSFRGSLYLTGTVPDQQTHDALIKSVLSAVTDAQIINELTVAASNIIRLDIKLLEVNRGKAEQFGVEWNAIFAANGYYLNKNNAGVLRFGTDDSQQSNLEVTLDLLQTNSIATVINETSLSTVFNKPANFEVGGAIPIPKFVTTDNDRDFSIDYKFVGLKLAFSSTRVEGNKIHLDIQSDITTRDAQSVSVNGNQFPTISSRSVGTQVELANHQSFVIAGLTKQENLAILRQSNDSLLSRVASKILAADSITKSNQELVIVVTPSFNNGEDKTNEIIKMLTESSNIQHLLQQKGARSDYRFQGQAGFIY